MTIASNSEKAPSAGVRSSRSSRAASSEIRRSFSASVLGGIGSDAAIRRAYSSASIVLRRALAGILFPISLRILFVGHDVQDEDLLRSVVHPRDQTVLVSGDVKHRTAPHLVRAAEVLAQLGEVLPLRLAADADPVGQRRHGVGMLFPKLPCGLPANHSQE